MNLIPNVSPKLYSLSAVALGYLLIDDLTANEQNAVGNWLMLVAQVLCTNAYYKQVQQERGIDSSDGSLSIDALNKTVSALQKQIEELKKQINS